MEQYSKLKLFDCGTQGFTGVLQDNDKKKFVFKVSKKINFNIEHEYVVMKRLNDLHFCPNFIKVYSLLNTPCEPNVRRYHLPFEITSKYPIAKKVLIEEFVEGKKFCHYIKHGSIPCEAIYECVKQTLCAIAVGQAIANLTHYDLHSDNIILTPCDPDNVFLYVFNENLAFAVPSYGFISKIIDFGYSYVDK